MSEIMEILKAIANTPLPIILVITGIIFLFFSFAKILQVIISDHDKKWLRILGSILLIVGIFVYVFGILATLEPLPPPSDPNPTPTSTSPPTPTPTSTPSLTININDPLNDDKVPLSIVVQGIISGELPKDRYMWIVVHPQDNIGWYPQVGRVVPFDGKWNAPAWIGKEGNVDIGKVYDIVVVLVSKDSDQYYLNYINEGSKTGNYPGIALPTDAIVYHKIKVTRK